MTQRREFNMESYKFTSVEAGYNYDLNQFELKAVIEMPAAEFKKLKRKGHFYCTTIGNALANDFGFQINSVPTVDDKARSRNGIKTIEIYYTDVFHWDLYLHDPFNKVVKPEELVAVNNRIAELERFPEEV